MKENIHSFIKENDKLTTNFQFEFSDTHQKCKIGETGQCFCEKAADLKEIIFCDNNHHHHSIDNYTKQPGHFCIPLMWQNEMHGLLILQSHLEYHGNKFEFEFLKIAGNAIANIIRTKKADEQLKIKVKKQTVLNQKLFAQSLEIDQKNIEIEEFILKLREANEELLTAEEELRQNNEELLTLNENLLEQKGKIVAQNEELSRKNIIIEKVHKNITDSINYAKKIQDALLTSTDFINACFNEYFLYYKPKDIVSGDFYYVNKINDNLIFAVADCTGHGVPGGFITILGITYLHDIVRLKEINKASDVLNNLRTHIKAIFRSFDTNNYHGMDLVFCAVNTKTNMLQYAGANNPLFIIRNHELIEYPATKNPIGYHPKEKEFENNEIQLYNNDVIYLLSDGFQDQFGGENKQRFTKKNLKKMLFEIHEMPLEKQQEIIENTLHNWQKDIDQIDDITILAVKWNC